VIFLPQTYPEPGEEAKGKVNGSPCQARKAKKRLAPGSLESSSTGDANSSFEEELCHCRILHAPRIQKARESALPADQLEEVTRLYKA
jgi:hypothetical protein